VHKNLTAVLSETGRTSVRPYKNILATTWQLITFTGQKPGKAA
jgi:hypothetical protein